MALSRLRCTKSEACFWSNYRKSIDGNRKNTENQYSRSDYHPRPHVNYISSEDLRKIEYYSENWWNLDVDVATVKMWTDTKIDELDIRHQHNWTTDGKEGITCLYSSKKYPPPSTILEMLSLGLLPNPNCFYRIERYYGYTHPLTYAIACLLSRYMFRKIKQITDDLESITPCYCYRKNSDHKIHFVHKYRHPINLKLLPGKLKKYRFVTVPFPKDVTQDMSTKTDLQRKIYNKNQILAKRALRSQVEKTDGATFLYQYPLNNKEYTDFKHILQELWQDIQDVKFLNYSIVKRKMLAAKENKCVKIVVGNKNALSVEEIFFKQQNTAPSDENVCTPNIPQIIVKVTKLSFIPLGTFPIGTNILIQTPNGNSVKYRVRLIECYPFDKDHFVNDNFQYYGDENAFQFSETEIAEINKRRKERKRKMVGTSEEPNPKRLLLEEVD